MTDATCTKDGCGREAEDNRLCYLHQPLDIMDLWHTAEPLSAGAAAADDATVAEAEGPACCRMVREP